MCCFSKPVISVGGTNIFARAGEGDKQFLVYSMTVKATEDLAMVLPLPTKAGTDENEVRFIDLSGYPDFFQDLNTGFPIPSEKGANFGCGAAPATTKSARLRVFKFGSFEASFVPSLSDFSRLDERFRISDRAWKQLPGYVDFGFAVFKLKSGEAKIHPMALSFPRRDRKTLFFPTVHIHDGEVHARAEFDHVLYCQPTEHHALATREWRESDRLANAFMKMDRAGGLIAPGQHCYQKLLQGVLPNRDTFLSIAA